jgi:phosphohistidine phosphatase
MPKQLWLLRHGEAEDHGTRPDFDRKLTERGEQQSRAAGAALRASGVDFAAVFTSPRLRALDTARICCEELDSDFILHEPLSGGFDKDDALELIAGFEDGDRILVVGHEPDFSNVVWALSGARAQMKKGGVAGVRLEGSQGELLILLRPRELELMGGH